MIMMIFIKHVRNSLKVITAIEDVIILMTHSETRDWRVGEYPSGRGGCNSGVTGMAGD